MEITQVCYEQNCTYARAIKLREPGFPPWNELSFQTKLELEEKIKSIIVGSYKENLRPPAGNVDRIMEALLEGMVKTLMEID